jgi:hypothetical protein
MPSWFRPNDSLARHLASLHTLPSHLSPEFPLDQGLQSSVQPSDDDYIRELLRQAKAACGSPPGASGNPWMAERVLNEQLVGVDGSSFPLPAADATAGQGDRCHERQQHQQGDIGHIHGSNTSAFSLFKPADGDLPGMGSLGTQSTEGTEETEDADVRPKRKRGRYLTQAEQAERVRHGVI